VSLRSPSGAKISRPENALQPSTRWPPHPACGGQPYNHVSRGGPCLRILLHLEFDKVEVYEGRANPIDLRFKVQLHVVLHLRSVP